MKNIFHLRSIAKFFFAITITLFAFKPASALVSNYTFSSSTTNYIAVTGTTLFTGTWDDGVSTLLTIPFTFIYNGTAYTSLGVSSNGFITLGSVPGSSTVYCGLQGAGANSIAGYGTDLVNASATSTIIYGSRGSAPNRQFVIQWTDCDHYGNASANHWSFQIILNETTNTVQVVWGTTTDATTMGANTCADVATESGNIGLLGSNTQDFNIRSVTNATNAWASSAAGTALTAVCNMSSSNFPAAGQTYTWTPGAVTPMSYTSGNTLYLNNGASVSRNSSGNQVLQLQVVTAGTISPFSVTSLSLSTAGCTNPGTDISNAKVYFTGNSSAFSTVTQFGSTFNNPNGNYTILGSVTLAEGTNYFWITYDITGAAGFGDNLSGCCSQIIGSGTMGARVPTVTCPVGSQTISQIGTWTAVSSLAPHGSGGGMLLLSDGTILCKSASGTDGYGNIYDKLTPNASGSYLNGTWSSIAPMNFTRLFYSTQLLKNGKVYVAGGEYGTGLARGEVYDPLTNVWTNTTNNPTGNVSDANSEILEDGRVLQGLVTGSLTATNIYTPSTNSYTTGPTALGIHNESAWLKLPDNSVLYVDRLTTSSERYIPASNTWISDATVPVALYDPYGDETGGALLLPDGRAFFIGALGHTAYYTPSGTTSPGTWAAGPDVPGAQGAPDAPMAMMANGKILCSVSPVPTSANHFPSPTKFYEFDYLTNSFTQVGVPGGGTSLPISCYITNLLDLPDGTVLYAIQQNAGSSQYYIYTPVGNPVVSGKPTITNIKQNTCTLFKITGTKFNGISEGSSYGDDWQLNSNYPIVRLTSGSNVYYARTANWNSTGVMRGNATDTAQFTLPAGLPAGNYSLVVVANGISSDPVTFNATPSLSSSLTPAAICSGNAFTYTPTSATSNATFIWTRAAVVGISNPAVTVPQSSNPNEVLINTIGSPVSVVYAYTINGGTCSNTQSVTVIVNPASGTNATITAGGPTTFCQGGSVLLSGNTTGGTWSVGGGTTSTLTATTAGDYFVTTTTGCGTLISNHITITINQIPTASAITAGGATTFCQGGNVILSGNSTGGTWSVGGGTSATLTATTSGDYFTATTNSCGSTTSNHITVTVNPLPAESAITAGGATTFCQGGNVILSGNSTGGTWSIGGGTTTTLTVTTAGDYFVTTTNSCGSTTSNHIAVAVNSLPAASAITAGGATTFCQGGNVILSGNSTGGTWSVGGGTTSTLTASTAGDYFVTTTNSCGSTFSNHISVTVNPLPTASSITAGGNTTFCQGGNVILSGNSTGGTWSVGGGTTTTLTATTAGDYFVTTTNSCGSIESNHITVTVNPLPTASAITASGNTAFCQGGNVILSGNSTGGTWSVGGGTSATLTATTAGDYFTTTTNSCGSITSNHIAVTVNPLPTASAITAGSATTFCQGGNVILSGNSTGGTWSIGGGTATTLIASTTGDYFVTTTNSCGSIESNHISVTVNPLPSASAITAGGNTTFCQGGNVILSGNSTGGTWSVGGGTTATLTATTAGDYFVTTTNSCGSTTSNHITVTVNSLPTASVISAGGATTFCQGGNVILSGNSTGGTWSIGGGTATTLIASTTGDYFVTTTNSCGSTTSNHISVLVNQLPAVSFSGLASSYSVSAAAVTLTGSPAGGTFSGPGISGNTFTPSVAGVGGPYTITYSFTNGSGCSNSSSQQTTVVNCTIPSRPGTISTVGGAAKVCPGEIKTYSISAVVGATSYTWAPPTGCVISNGQGTVTVVVSYTATFTASGTLSVVANNACGTSTSRTLTITRSTPATPGTITGLAAGVCSASGVPYSVVTVTGITYNWTFSVANASISSGQGTNAVTADFLPAYSSGQIRVTASNACGVSAQRTKTVASISSIPTSIAGAIVVCANQFGVPYSTAAVTGATSYTWTGPTGSHISDGVTTSVTNIFTTTSTSVTVNYGASSGSLNVKSNNACGSSSNRTITIAFNCKLDGSVIVTDFTLFPNPTDGLFTVEISNPENYSILKVENILGQTILIKNIGGENSINIQLPNEIAKGIYMVRLIGENAMDAKQIVLQ